MTKYGYWEMKDVVASYKGLEYTGGTPVSTPVVNTANAPAQSLEISENTVKSRMNYGKAPLTDAENSQNTGSSPQNAQPNIQHKKKPDVDCPAFVVMSLFYSLLPQFPQKILIFGFSFPHFTHRFVGGAEFRTYEFCLSFSGI